MIKRSFIGLSKPWLYYSRIEGKTRPPVSIPVPSEVRLFLRDSGKKISVSAEKGSEVLTGQIIFDKNNPENYVMSTVTGKIAGFEKFTGNFGQDYIQVIIDPADEEKIDSGFNDPSPEPSFLKSTFLNAPGRFGLKEVISEEIETVCILGVDSDLLLTTSYTVLALKTADLKKGISVLKEAFPEKRIMLAVPRDMFQGFGHTGAELVAVDPRYPGGHPKMIMRECFGKTVAEGRDCKDYGVGFISAETIVSIGRAFSESCPPVYKTITVINKNNERIMATARIGTPVRAVFDSLKITADSGDRVILGGPMNGSAIFTLDHPVLPDTDGIILQGEKSLALYSDYPCTNCGECVRICPASIQVNMLVRFLEAGQYEEAADLYDLNCCIDCGLCSFVCISNIPVFQYIQLAKHELARAQKAEASSEASDE